MDENSQVGETQVSQSVIESNIKNPNILKTQNKKLLVVLLILIIIFCSLVGFYILNSTISKKTNNLSLNVNSLHTNKSITPTEQASQLIKTAQVWAYGTTRYSDKDLSFLYPKYFSKNDVIVLDQHKVIFSNPYTYSQFDKICDDAVDIIFEKIDNSQNLPLEQFFVEAPFNSRIVQSGQIPKDKIVIASLSALQKIDSPINNSYLESSGYEGGKGETENYYFAYKKGIYILSENLMECNLGDSVLSKDQLTLFNNIIKSIKLN